MGASQGGGKMPQEGFDNHTNIFVIILQIIAAAAALVLANGGQTLQEEQLPDGNTIVITKQT